MPNKPYDKGKARSDRKTQKRAQASGSRKDKRGSGGLEGPVTKNQFQPRTPSGQNKPPAHHKIQAHSRSIYSVNAPTVNSDTPNNTSTLSNPSNPTSSSSVTTTTGQSVLIPSTLSKASSSSAVSKGSTTTSGPTNYSIVGPAPQQIQAMPPSVIVTKQEPASSTSAISDDYKLLLTPVFAAMSKITDNLYLTGVGGMTKENFRRNHIDFVINITTEAPFWEDTSVESWRLPIEDDIGANILPLLDTAADRIHEAISRRGAHVLVHCVAGVSRSATIVIAYLMKHRRMDLKTAFNHCYGIRPVIRPNNGFMMQLIQFEQQLFSRQSVKMVEADVDGTVITVPQFFIDEHPNLVILEVMRVKDLTKSKQAAEGHVEHQQLEKRKDQNT